MDEIYKMFKNLPKFNEQNFIHFITSKTFQNYSFFKNDKCCLILLDELSFYREKLSFKILGYVIMPDHLHCLIWLDVEKDLELTISKIMMAIKGYSAKLIVKHLGRLGQLPQPTREGEDKLHRRGLKYQIWQKGFYDFNVYTKQKFQEKIDYIYKNPIVAGICENSEDYQWSSYRQIIGIDKNPVLKIDYLEL